MSFFHVEFKLPEGLITNRRFPVHQMQIFQKLQNISNDLSVTCVNQQLYGGMTGIGAV